MTSSIIGSSNKAVKKVLIVLFWLALWQLLYIIIRQDLYLPSPVSVFVRLHELIMQAAFWQSVGYSFCRVLAGLALSIVVGVTTGILASLNRHVYDLMNPMVTAIKATPVMSFIILTLVWFSSSQVPIFICFLMCFPIIWTNVVEGVRNVDAKLLEMAKVFKASFSLVIRRIYLPSILPYFIAACLTSFGLGWKVSVAAEVLSHPAYAIGSNLYSAKAYLDSTGLFAWTFVVIVLSIIFESIFALFTSKAMRAK